jgi:hypothetical protein
MPCQYYAESDHPACSAPVAALVEPNPVGQFAPMALCANHTYQHTADHEFHLGSDWSIIATSTAAVFALGRALAAEDRDILRMRALGAKVAADRYSMPGGPFGSMTRRTCAWTLDDGHDCGGPAAYLIETEQAGIGGGCCALHILFYFQWALDETGKVSVEAVS